MLRIAVVEDDAPTREKLCTLIRDHAVSKGKDLAVTPLEDGSSLLGGALSGYDIIFLDIMLPGLTGMEVAERIRAGDPDVVLVFVTNAAQYAIKGYAVGALDFVLKPVNPYEFLVKLERALERAAQRRQRPITLQTADGVQVLVSGLFFQLMTLPVIPMSVNHLWLLWLLAYAGQAAALLFLTRLRRPGAAYCAVWSMTLTQLSAEAGLLLWYALQRFHWPKAESARKPADFPTRLAQLFLKY